MEPSRKQIAAWLDQVRNIDWANVGPEQIDGSEEGFKDNKPAGGVLTGFAIGLFEGGVQKGWVVLRLPGNCAGGYLADENWHAAAKDWPASFELRLLLASYEVKGTADWYDPAGSKVDGPKKGTDALFESVDTPVGTPRVVLPPFHLVFRGDDALVALAEHRGNGGTWTSTTDSTDALVLKVDARLRLLRLDACVHLEHAATHPAAEGKLFAAASDGIPLDPVHPDDPPPVGGHGGHGGPPPGVIGGTAPMVGNFVPNAQIDGSEEGFAPIGVNSSPDGYAFRLSTGDYFVRAHTDNCAGGFTTGEYWPRTADGWPGYFTLQLSLASYVFQGKPRWFPLHSELPIQGGPTKNGSPYKNDVKAEPDGDEPPSPKYEVRKGNELTHWVQPTEPGGKWTHKRFASRLTLREGEEVSFTRV